MYLLKNLTSATQISCICCSWARYLCYPYSLFHLEYSCRTFDTQTARHQYGHSNTYFRPKPYNIFMMFWSVRTLKRGHVSMQDISSRVWITKLIVICATPSYVVDCAPFWYFQEILLLMEKLNTPWHLWTSLNQWCH